MYYFSSLALTLNEAEEGVAPTDSRRRPDQRLMEDGRWDEANAEKQRLEEKQRSTRRERERDAVNAAATPEEGKEPVEEPSGPPSVHPVFHLNHPYTRLMPESALVCRLGDGIISHG